MKCSVHNEYYVEMYVYLFNFLLYEIPGHCIIESAALSVYEVKRNNWTNDILMNF